MSGPPSSAAPETSRARRTAGGVALTVLLSLSVAGVAEAQRGTAPSTLRYGTGLLDVPVAGVPPHLSITGTFSAFSVDVPARPRVGFGGAVIDEGDPWSRWFSDGSVTVGLFDRGEVGVSLQSFSAPDSGGTSVGGFGHVLLLDPAQRDGLGFAVGARYLPSPRFEGSAYEGEYRPGRLGFADARVRRSYGRDGEGIDTNLTPYAVVSGTFPGFDIGYVPRHDFTFALGWGGGLFAEGGAFPWYASSSSGGWFLGGASHLEVRSGTVLHLTGEYNGFDTNVGAQVDIGGIRVGTFVLGVNHDDAVSAYRSRKWGVSASFAFCPLDGGGCGPRLRDRPATDTVQLPAPPPDTIRVPVGDTLRRKNGVRRGGSGVREETARSGYVPLRVWRWPEDLAGERKLRRR